MTKKQPTPLIPKQEIATAKRDYSRYQAYIKMSRNPDPILNKTKEGKEKGIALFAEMKRDCHISYCLRRLTLGITRNRFAVIPGGDSAQDIEAAEFIEGQIKNHYYNLVSFILDAMPIGFSVSEFWCKEVEGRIEIDQLKKRRQERFSFDENGNLLIKTEQKPNGELPELQEGFIVVTYQEEDNNKFGDGILSTCFWPWFMKKNGLLFWANSLERFNQPIAVGTYPVGTKLDKQDDFLAALESIQSDFAITIPEGWKIELQKGMDSGAYDSFENFQGYMDRAISKALNGSAVNQGEQKFGSRGSNETLKEISDEDIEAAAEFAIKEINWKLVPRLCDWNFSLAAYPEFVILYKNKKLTKEEADVINLLANVGVAVPAADIYEAQGWKTPEPDDLVLYKGKMIAYKEIAGENAKIAPTDLSKNPIQFADPPPPEVPADPPLRDVPADRQVVSDGELIDNVFAGTGDNLRKAYDEEQLIGLIDKAGDYKAASKALLKYKPKNLEETWREIIELGRWLGEYSISRQTAGASFAEPVLSFDKAFEASFRKLTPKEAIAWLKSKIPVTKDVYDRLSGDAKNAAFYVAGLEDIDMINAMREQMIRAMEKGIPYEQFARDLKAATGADPFFSNMKTAFYTNIHQAMAAQDYQALERVKGLVPYRRYSAILDTHTRPEHAKWHDFVAPADDPIWDYLYSLLMDYNCRCRITAAPDSDYERLADSSAAQRGDGKYPTYETNPTQMNSEKLKELLQVRKEYADYLDSKLGSWAKIMAKMQGK